ncbi:conserved hypothetical protein, partial [Ricinus communis]
AAQPLDARVRRETRMGVDAHRDARHFQWQVQQHAGLIDVVALGDAARQEQRQVGIAHDLRGHREMRHAQREIALHAGVAQHVLGQLVAGGIGVGVDVAQLQQAFHGQRLAGLGMGLAQHADVVVIEHQLALAILGQARQIAEGQVDVAVAHGGTQIFHGHLLDFDGN